MFGERTCDHVDTVQWDRLDDLLVGTTTRGTNAIGGVVTNWVLANVDLTGNVIEAVERAMGALGTRPFSAPLPGGGRAVTYPPPTAAPASALGGTSGDVRGKGLDWDARTPPAQGRSR